MIKLYNTEDYFVNNFKDYFSKLDYHLSLPKLNILSHLLPATVKVIGQYPTEINAIFSNHLMI